MPVVSDREKQKQTSKQMNGKKKKKNTKTTLSVIGRGGSGGDKSLGRKAVSEKVV